ncbi:acyl-CoA thioesterase II [Citricoccus sp. SGAir0253]|uniref:acyl-CoA thioesterase n=1 Tax=Citricoccus sp. SGAir0253 TaxID=2567881 RepID=UPI0010CCD541|nr:acyl-CoA thioesterase II [Citricoccus sp. SGAir0253]QCU78293.1 acyl-CoA thioesterase II [Citricoccus sp. SGAir0253]
MGSDRVRRLRENFPEDPTDVLRRVLSLTPEGSDERTGEALFTGLTPPQARGRVFGGQVMAQSLMAAIHTVDAGRAIHSMHGYFIRPGDALQPIRFAVEDLRDGRSFSVRRVHADQDGKTILSLMCSFQEPSPGLDHQSPMPNGVPEPESLPATSQRLGHVQHPVAQEWAWARPFDIRHVDSPLEATPGKERVATNMVWMKTFSGLEGDANVHRAALAYASDYTLLEPVLRRHGLAWVRPGMSVASLDHAMWWHRPARVDEWLLYVQTSHSAQGARGLSHGRIYSREGELVASVAQEGMIRVPNDARNRVRGAVQDLFVKTAWRPPRQSR